MERRRIVALAIGLTLTGTPGCRLLQPPPSDQEVIAAVKKSPPAPPTAGPTYVAELMSVHVESRGPYNTDGKYWPARVRVKGGVKVKLTNVFQLGLLSGDANKLSEPIEFVEEARFTKDDFGKWRVWYEYDPRAAKWRLDHRDGSRRDR